jgi:hypothetical protein
VKKADAELMVVRLWHDWPDRYEPASPGKGLRFYSWLCAEHPHVMEFRASSDKWQVMSGWLNRHQLH